MPKTWEDYIRMEEEANEGACLLCAIANGHTAKEAENCELGNVGCPDCPFTDPLPFDPRWPQRRRDLQSRKLRKERK